MQYPNIAQPQYGFGPTMPMMPSMSDMPPAMMNFKKGGDVEERRTYGLENAAEMLRRQGRNGDTILAHINPEEAGILKLLGGSGTINPYTGLPEFGRLSKAFKSVTKPITSAFKSVVNTVAPVLNKIAPIIPFLPIPGLGPLSSLAAKALLTGVASGVDKEGKFNLGRGLKAGALSYGLGSLMQNLQAAGPNTITDPISNISDVIDPNAAVNLPTPMEGIPTDTGAAIYGGAPTPTATAAPTFNPAIDDLVVPGSSTASLPQQSSLIDRATSYVSDIPSKIEAGIKSLPETISNLPGQALKAITPTSAKDALLTASLATTAYGSVKSLQELEAQKEEAERILRQQEQEKAEDVAWAQSVLRDYPINYRRLTAEDVRAQQGMAGGGLAGLNAFKSGGAPRFLKGNGDGMSDDIPATIGGRQKAALSDGEFVIPADVVSHLGNGSSRAGAKKLYSMMDNIRKARTGKKRQAPEVSANRYMPA